MARIGLLLLRWMRDDLVRQLMKNAGMLFGANVVVSLLGLASLAVTARSLGAQTFGVLTLITTYVLVVDKLVNFQSWQALIKYGADCIEQKQSRGLAILLKFGFVVDFSTALLGAALSILVALLIGNRLGWEPQTIVYVGLYSLTIALHISGTPVAILRLFDRFDLLALHSVLFACVKLVGVLLAFVLDGGLGLFLLVWAVSDVVSHLAMLALSLFVVRQERVHGLATASLAGVRERFPGILGFLWATNLNGSIRMTSRELDVFVVAALLGSSAVGVYKVAKQFSLIVSKAVDPLYKAIYPQLSRLAAVRDMGRFVQLATRAAMLVGAVALGIWSIFYVVGEAVILLVVGKEYLESAAVLSWYMLAMVVAAASFPLQPAMLAIGKPYLTLWVHLASTTLYFVALPVLTVAYGVPGAGAAYLVYYVIWAGIMLALEVRILGAGRYRGETRLD